MNSLNHQLTGMVHTSITTHNNNTQTYISIGERLRLNNPSVATHILHVIARSNVRKVEVGRRYKEAAGGKEVAVGSGAHHGRMVV